MTDHFPTGAGYVVTAVVTAACMYGAGFLKEWFKGQTEGHVARSKAHLDMDAQEHTQTVEVYEATVKRLERSNVDLIAQVQELQRRQTECERRDAAQGERIKWLEQTLEKAMTEIAALKQINRERGTHEQG